MDKAGFLTTREAAERLKKSRATLKDWRAKGIGPPYRRYLNQIYYPLVQFEDWLRENLGVQGQDPVRRSA